MLEGWWSQWPFSAVIRKHNLWSPGSHWQISRLVRQDTGRGILQARLKVNIYTVYLMVSTQHFAYSDCLDTKSRYRLPAAQGTMSLQNKGNTREPSLPFYRHGAVLPLLLRRTCRTQEGAQAAAKAELPGVSAVLQRLPWACIWAWAIDISRGC